MVMHSDLFAWDVRSPEALKCSDCFAVAVLSQQLSRQLSQHYQGPLKCLWHTQYHHHGSYNHVTPECCTWRHTKSHFNTQTCLNDCSTNQQPASLYMIIIIVTLPCSFCGGGTVMCRSIELAWRSMTSQNLLSLNSLQLSSLSQHTNTCKVGTEWVQGHQGNKYAIILCV